MDRVSPVCYRGFNSFFFCVFIFVATWSQHRETTFTIEQWNNGVAHTHTHTHWKSNIYPLRKKRRIFENILTSETLFRRKFAANNKNYEERNFNQLEKKKRIRKQIKQNGEKGKWAEFFVCIVNGKEKKLSVVCTNTALMLCDVDFLKFVFEVVLCWAFCFKKKKD